MIYAYLRYSTSKQDEHEQEVIISRYCSSHNLKIDEYFVDRAVSGADDWQNRENLADLVSKLVPGDTILCSEASRISRSMSDFSSLINDCMRKLQIRFIVCNLGLDIDCSNMSAVVEIMLQMLIFSGQFERDMLRERINASFEHIRAQIKTSGGWVSKSGNWRTHLGPPNVYISRKGGAANAKRKQIESMNVSPKVLATIIDMQKNGMTLAQIATTLNNMGLCTASGKKWYAMTIKRILIAYGKYGTENSIV